MVMLRRVVVVTIAMPWHFPLRGVPSFHRRSVGARQAGYGAAVPLVDQKAAFAAAVVVRRAHGGGGHALLAMQRGVLSRISQANSGYQVALCSALPKTRLCISGVISGRRTPHSPKFSNTTHDDSGPLQRWCSAPVEFNLREAACAARYVPRVHNALRARFEDNFCRATPAGARHECHGSGACPRHPRGCSGAQDAPHLPRHRRGAGCDRLRSVASSVARSQLMCSFASRLT